MIDLARRIFGLNRRHYNTNDTTSAYGDRLYGPHALSIDGAGHHECRAGLRKKRLYGIY